jgi:hypothetical protein
MPAAVGVQVTSVPKVGASCTVRGVPGVTCTVPTAHGSATICQDGTYTYTPATGYTGLDSFRYEIIDGSGQRASANVDVTISGQPDVVTSVTLSPVAPLPGAAVTAIVSSGNIGPVSALDVSVTLQIPAGMDGVIASHGGRHAAMTGVVTWPVIASIPASTPSFASYTVSFVPTPNSFVVVSSNATTPSAESSVANNVSEATLLASATPVPSLEGWMLTLLSFLLVGIAFLSQRSNVNKNS